MLVVCGGLGIVVVGNCIHIRKQPETDVNLKLNDMQHHYHHAVKGYDRFVVLLWKYDVSEPARLKQLQQMSVGFHSG